MTNPSESRLDTLNRVFTAYFGQHWPWVLFGYALLIGIILFQVYMFRPTVQIKVKDSKHIKKYTMFIVLLLSVIILLLGILSLHTYLKKQNEEDQKTQTFPTGIASKPPYIQIMIIFSILLLIVFLLVLSGWWILKG